MRTVREARAQDYPRILDILNQAIARRNCTALLTPATIENRQPWFRAHEDGLHPIYVCEENGGVLGWLALTAYRDGREGFKRACEVSYYIDEDARRAGVASALMRHAIDGAGKQGLTTLMAVIFADNGPSRALAEKFGFELWGRFPNIIEIDGREIDCLQYGLRL